MLKNNIYIMNPPGYAGSFLRWILAKSEVDSAEATVDNPINYGNTKKYGGFGNAHQFERKPTHVGISQLMLWLITNSPTGKNIYILNEGEFLGINRKQHGMTSGYIANFDSAPIIINLHSNCELDKIHFGFMNLCLKWPFSTETKDYIGSSKFPVPIEQYNTRAGRNAYVENWSNTVYYNDPLTVEQVKQTHSYRRHQEWIDIRNPRNPHEVNRHDGQWITPDLSRLYNIDFTDIFFNPDRLYDSLELITKDEGTFDFSYCRRFHQTYIDNQPTLKFIDSINKFRATGELDPLLTSHAAFEACVIQEILPNLPSGTVWQSMELSEIVKLIK